MEKHELVQFSLKNGATLFVEVEQPRGGGLKPVARETGEIAVKAKKTFEEAMKNLEPMITSIKEQLDAANQPADEVEVKFGVKLSSEVGAILASVGGEITYEITLKWNNSKL
jgi:hypothetical protein